MLGLEIVNVLPRKPVWLMHVSTQQNSKLQINQTTMKVLKASSSNFGSLFFMNKKTLLCFPPRLPPIHPPTRTSNGACPLFL